MRFNCQKIVFTLSLLLLGVQFSVAKTGRYRLTWREDPSTSMVIGWDQMSGSAAKVFYDVVNHGAIPDKYAFNKVPDNVVVAKGMNNHFVRLGGLRPNTTYYFLVADNEGSSAVFSFRTVSDRPTDRLSIIAGSDSRNHRKARQDANKMVGKLRPHLVMFGGDFTENESDAEWKEWLDDWQNTIAKDGRMFPVLVGRGNHEFSNETLVNLFDVKSPTITYAMSFGGDLLRFYNLNSTMAPGGDQKAFLQRDLAAHPHVTWKIAQYHFPIRPHTSGKEDQNDQYEHWATLFHEYGVQLAIESDAHVIKSTYPLRPSTESGSSDGFIRDDETGTVFIGEGCWGAPLRQNDDPKPWTRASGSFNAFHWIFLDQDKMEIRFVKTDGADYVADVNPMNVFETPRGLNVWNPPTGDVITIPRERVDIFASLKASPSDDDEDLMAFVSRGEEEVEVGLEILDFSANRQGPDVIVKWTTRNEPEKLRYELQRSTDNKEYQPLKIFEAKGGEGSAYEFVDNGFAGANPGRFVNYRLRQIHSDGSSDIYNPKSDAKPVRPGMEVPKLMMDPATKEVKVKYALEAACNLTVRLLSLTKGEVRKWDMPNQQPGKYLRSLDLRGIPPGRYLITLKNGEEVLQRYRVVIN